MAIGDEEEERERENIQRKVIEMSVCVCVQKSVTYFAPHTSHHLPKLIQKGLTLKEITRQLKLNAFLSSSQTQYISHTHFLSLTFSLSHTHTFLFPTTAMASTAIGSDTKADAISDEYTKSSPNSERKGGGENQSKERKMA